VGTSVIFGDRSFRVGQIWSHESLDLRVARIESTDGMGVLDQWARVSYGQAETGQAVRIGGFGRTNASTLLSDSGDPYGYEWTQEGGELTWGVNIVDRTYGMLGSGDDAGYMYISFDDVNEGNYLPGEIGMATGDSGGGWFLQEEGGIWRAAGMTISTDRSGATRFRDPATLDPDPDRSYALRLGPAASWIRAVVNGTSLPGDADSNGLVNFADYVIVSTHFGQQTDSWSKGDFNGDGRTDGADLQILRTHYGQLSTLDDPVVPEPSCLVLLAGGTLGCLLRKKRRLANG
jgi:hypothetical protein